MILFPPARKLLAGTVFAALWSAAAFATIHVTPEGNNHNDGLTWDTAKQTIQAGIDAAASAAPGEVWVARGTYTERITLADGVAVYGGFRGDEADRGQLKLDPNTTVIDGAAGGSVVTSPAGLTSSTVLSNLTVRNGTGLRGLASDRYGGGILIDRSSPRIQGCVITANSAAGSSSQGGGIYISGTIGSAAPTITGNIISGNNAGDRGGGIYTQDASPSITGNTFLSNTARRGGGFYAAFTGAATFDSNTFQGNHANFGGAGYVAANDTSIQNNTFTGNDALSNLLNDGYGGALYVYFVTTPAIIRNTYTGNRANYGAALAVRQASPSVLSSVFLNNGADVEGGAVWVNGDYPNPDYTARPLVANNTLAGNTAPAGGGMHFSLRCAPRIANNIVAFNGSGLAQATAASAVLFNNDVFGNGTTDYSGLTPAANDMAVDPLFYNQSAGNLRLVSASPCIDRGDTFIVGANDKDRDGVARIQGAAVDLGAYETPTPTPFSMADVDTALRIAGGISSATQDQGIRWNIVIEGPSAGRIDAMDAARLMRKVHGLEPNP